MRTVTTYLDKNKNRTTKENAWTVMTQVFNDAGNLQRTGYSIGEAQARAAKPKEGDARTLRLRDVESGEVRSFTKNVVKVGRDEGCDKFLLFVHSVYTSVKLNFIIECELFFVRKLFRERNTRGGEFVFAETLGVFADP